MRLGTMPVNSIIDLIDTLWLYACINLIVT